MHFKLIQTSLICSFLLIFAVHLPGMLFPDNLLGSPGYLLTPGVWLVYGLFEVNNHDLLPLIMAELANLLIYWIVFIPLLALWRTLRRSGAAGSGQA